MPGPDRPSGRGTTHTGGPGCDPGPPRRIPCPVAMPVPAMPPILRRLLACLVACLSASASPAASAREGAWLLSIDRWGNPEYRTLELSATGPRLAGSLQGTVVEGHRDGERVAFTAGDPADGGYRFEGWLRDDALEGRIEYPDPNDARRRVWHAVRGR